MCSIFNNKAMKDKYLDKAILDCYRELYLNSEPEADFDELVKNAKLNDNGQKDIEFMKYEIDEDKFYSIIDDIIIKHKIRKDLIQYFKNTILLGCSPKFKT